MNSALGRRVLHAMIASPKDWETTDSRATFLEKRRPGLDELIDRAVERGECPAGIDAARLIDLLGACLSSSLLFHDRLITDDDCEEVVDVMLNGFIGKE